MVEPVTLGLAAALLLSKTMEKATDEAADGVVDGVTKAVAWIRRRFAGRQELLQLEAAPDSPGRQRAFAGIVEAELLHDPAVRVELRSLLEAVSRADPNGVRIGFVLARDGGVAVVGDVNGGISTTSGGGGPGPIGGTGTP